MRILQQLLRFCERLGLQPLKFGRLAMLRLTSISVTVVALALLLLLFFLFVAYPGLSRVIGKRTPGDRKNVVTISDSWTAGVPHVYEDEVDFRVIVLTFRRARSLSILLETLDEVVLDGDKGALEIWIDRDKNGSVSSETLQVARSFHWKHGPTRVHLHSGHAGIYGQWIYTWTPKRPQTKEVALILEDDLNVSKYAYRWLKPIHRFYRPRNDFAGASLTSDDHTGTHDGSNSVLKAPKNETIFMYKCIGTWGFSPKPSVWRDFQDWYRDIRIKDRNFGPYVLDILPTRVYQSLEQTGRENSMWEMWFIYFAYKEKLFTIYNNLRFFNADNSSCLSINRREAGLHQRRRRKGYEFKSPFTLLSRWEDSFVSLSNNITKLDWDGKAISQYDN